MRDASLTRAIFAPIFYLLLAVFMACSGTAMMTAANADTAKARDFLMMKLYEAALKQTDALESQAALSSRWLSQQSSNSTQVSAIMAMSSDLYGCKLWLGIQPLTNNGSNLVVTLHNTIPGWNYRLWSKEQLVATSSWTLETNLFGASGQDWTSATVPMNQGSNLFFFVTVLGEFATNKSFAGLQFTNSAFGNPDSMGAVGRDHFLEVLNAYSTNSAVAVFDKCSGLVLQQVQNRQFFAVQLNGTNYPTGDTVDPRVLYDHLANRWIATTLDAGSQNVILAVSKSSNPLDLLTNWIKSVIPFARDSVSTDFPTLGFDADGLYLSVSLRTSVATYASNVIAAIKKPEVYQGTNLVTFLNVATNDLPAASIQPALNYDATPRGGYAWFVAKRWRDHGTPYQGGSVCYRRLLWSGTNANWADTAWLTITNSPTYRDYFDLDEGDIGAPQAGASSFRIGLGDTGSRLTMALIRGGALWICHHVGLSETNGTYTGDESGASVSRSGIQWLKLSAETNGSFLSHTNGRIYDPTNNDPRYYYFPSLAVNAAGDLVLGFSGSKSNEYVSAFYSWRAAAGTQAVAPILLHAGNSELPNQRFGDYSSTTVDPLDQMTLWTVQGFVDDAVIQENYWGTWISEIVPSLPSP